MEAMKEIEAIPVNWAVRYAKLAAVCIEVETLNDGFIKPGIADFVPNALNVMTYNIFPLYIQILHQIRSQMVEVNMSQW